mgnify:CR=1 FL=1
MTVDDLVELAMAQDKLSETVAEQLFEYGIVELLRVGISYPEVIVLLEKAEIAINRAAHQRVTWPSAAVEVE